jgi:putative YhbY family RNA-binding protein
MAELVLDRDARLALKARAHALNPVVLLGAAGLTDAVLKEIDRALAAHELIKVRVPGDDRAEREAIFSRVAEALGAARVQMIGKLLVLYRPRPAQEVGSRESGVRSRGSGAASSQRRPARKPPSPVRRRPR